MSNHLFEIVFQNADFEFEGRDDVEEPLEEALSDAELGEVTGGGSGPDTTNIDVEVTELEAGLALVRKVLLEIGAAKSTEIQYHIEGKAKPRKYRLQD
ncbi:hypothetical protein EON80_28405 [bacterium]|nr:MAG: hypothetical protein EON80_28405 [bacterium]